MLQYIPDEGVSHFCLTDLAANQAVATLTQANLAAPESFYTHGKLSIFNALGVSLLTLCT